MAKEGSVAPQERVNITYKPATGNAQEEVELPLKMLFLGDYTGRHDPRPLEERKPINVDKDNFQQVLADRSVRAGGSTACVAMASPEGVVEVAKYVPNTLDRR